MFTTNELEDDLFAPESVKKPEEDIFIAKNAQEKSSIGTWKVLVVDDESDIHQMTKVVLDNFVFEDKQLEIFNVHSAQEAKQILVQHSDIAVILLDVVMETNDAGLKLVKYIRHTIKNRFVRIILRTGQPGHAPEKDVIRTYEINDYTNKADLTAQKIFTIVVANLRAYSEIMAVEFYRLHLEEKVKERTSALSDKSNQLTELSHKLTKLNEDLLRLNREKDEFLGIAAHDLKNPLSAIRGYAEEIQEYFMEMPEEEVIELVSRIHVNSRQMFDLIKLLLDVNAIETGQMNLSLNTVDVLPILQLLIVDYTVLAKKKNITLQFQVTEKQYLAFVDKNVFRQILDNLISNAVKYSPYDKKIVVNLHEKGQFLYCEVRDDGPGLNCEDKEKLFGKFNRLTPKPTGGEHAVGLGLFIVKKLVTALGGAVSCESEIGRGTTFMVEFPIKKESSNMYETT